MWNWAWGFRWLGGWRYYWSLQCGAKEKNTWGSIILNGCSTRSSGDRPLKTNTGVLARVTCAISSRLLTVHRSPINYRQICSAQSKYGLVLLIACLEDMIPKRWGTKGWPTVVCCCNVNSDTYIRAPFCKEQHFDHSFMLPKIKPMITDVTVILDTEKRSSKTQGIGYVLGQMPRLVMLLVFASSSDNCI